MLTAGAPSVFAFGLTGRLWIRRPGGMSCLGLRSRARSTSAGGRAAVCMDCFRTPVMKTEKKDGVEIVRRNGDLWAEGIEGSSSKTGIPKHLVVMVNGLVGSAEDWRFAAEQFIKKLPDKVIVHPGSACNSSRLTFDGVDLMGERLADEVLSVVNEKRGILKISFVAHSLGGLIARYAIGRLYEPSNSFSSPVTTNQLKEDDNWQGTIAGLEAMNFITFASPHLGSRGHKQLPFLCGLPFLEQRASEAAHLIVGRTGKHLFLTDDDGRPPLLLRMVDDGEDIKFMSALRSFRRRVAYANANYDHMVGWRTSSIRRQQELPKYHLLVEDENYPHIVHVDKGDNKNALEEASSDVLAQKYDLEESMIQGLTQVPWERVDVSFQKSRQRYIAHNTIQEFMVFEHYIVESTGFDRAASSFYNFFLV
ncbi:uncharacterized protein LOC110026119 isoform X3 [Phalaenopsis equestris]|uniref:uncharacterized protein LOC110026119 isoform X3 n=1 Tax=Phalaenopsis equestris TaxID=78828 RepID=UPI0009E47611|nr:uncharacterized protein LOC110026119 isoform X3 [Phalaenopsis equestris]